MSRASRLRGLIAGLLSVGLLTFILFTAPQCAETTSFSEEAGVDAAVDGLPIADMPPAVDQYLNPCAPGPPPTVTGKVYAPNGVDPVAGASVHVPLGLVPIPKSVRCESCSVLGKFTAHTYAKADGSFELKGVPNGKFKLGIQKGYFRRIIEVDMPTCGKVELTKDKTTLPGKNAQYSQWDTVPSIAVITGVWDKMEKVLNKLGLDPGAISIYNGRDYGTGPTSMQNLLQNTALLKSHHMVLVNCGTKFEALVTTAGPARSSIREYVRAGGRLFVTDLSYDYVEQTFPEFIDFESSESTPETLPETHNAAEKGTASVVQAELKDADLKAWLDLPEIKALLPNGKVKIEGFEASWAVQKSANSKLATKVWVTAPAIWAGGKGVRPMTTSFDFFDTDNKGCGRVTYSSYHTWGSATALLPQERILEYLILEIGTCVDIK